LLCAPPPRPTRRPFFLPPCQRRRLSQHATSLPAGTPAPFPPGPQLASCPCQPAPFVCLRGESTRINKSRDLLILVLPDFLVFLTSLQFDQICRRHGSHSVRVVKNASKKYLFLPSFGQTLNDSAQFGYFVWFVCGLCRNQNESAEIINTPLWYKFCTFVNFKRI
jgi:hypothetical protein